MDKVFVFIVPFNIIIKKGDKQIDLNIHPQPAGSFKVVYNRTLIGEIFVGVGESWEALSADDLDAEAYPIYEFDETSGYADLLLGHEVVQQIGRQLNLCLGHSVMGTR